MRVYLLHNNANTQGSFMGCLCSLVHMGPVAKDQEGVVSSPFVGSKRNFIPVGLFLFLAQCWILSRVIKVVAVVLALALDQTQAKHNLAKLHPWIVNFVCAASGNSFLLLCTEQS